MADPEPEESALPFLPEQNTLPALRQAVQGCRGCPLWEHATQAVFGEGRPSARVMLIGEQPGSAEDLQGRPFVGPAGRVLDEALQAAGFDRKDVYVTNVVKHFKWEEKGKRRIHKSPYAREIEACRPWLDREIELVKPEVLVCLGATAAQALLGREFSVSRQRGQLITTGRGLKAIATVHPSSILRQPTPEGRHQAMEEFTDDLKAVARFIEQ